MVCSKMLSQIASQKQEISQASVHNSTQAFYNPKWNQIINKVKCDLYLMPQTEEKM